MKILFPLSSFCIALWFHEAAVNSLSFLVGTFHGIIEEESGKKLLPFNFKGQTYA